MTQLPPKKQPKPKPSLAELKASGAIVAGSAVLKKIKEFNEAAEYELQNRKSNNAAK